MLYSIYYTRVAVSRNFDEFTEKSLVYSIIFVSLTFLITATLVPLLVAREY